MTEDNNDNNAAVGAVVVSMCAKLLESLQGHAALVTLVRALDDKAGRRHELFLVNMVLQTIDYAMTLDPPDGHHASLTEMKHRMLDHRDKRMAEFAKL